MVLEPNRMPEVTRQDIVAGLQNLGLSAGHQVIVHSSLKSFGKVAGGPDAIIQALMEVLTPAGTLMMPSFNHGKAFEPDGPGIFDPLTTPTTNGAIPQVFWQMPGVHRSLHPTHSFAVWGKHAAEYTRRHHRTLTCGADSPLGLMGQAGGFGLLMGVNYNTNTFHHVVETVLQAPCLGTRTVALPMRLPDGRIVEGRTWGWRQRGCPITDGKRYAAEMARRGLERQTMVGQSTLTLFRLMDCFSVVAELLTNGIDDLPPCSKCSIRPRQTASDVASDWDQAHGCLMPNSPAMSY